ncbi:Trafficking protein particle complex subunit 5 [Tupaia chinensis]|uniref:Trafficking protein particle complex subunit 5 n=1 Tax=Tupaia chinensis TaxID=246437 RepID=L8Y4W7_TUPCH|nr:Trafficking protein particle complex subunit 5 [Tupaia chinensis]
MAAGDNDPDYENITLAFRNRDPLKSDHSPRSPAPAQPRPLSDSAQIPPWLHKAIMILYVLLAFTFAFCIILSVLLLVKNSEMSQELLDLRGELWNVSNSMRVCQEEQQKGWNLVWERVKEARESILQVDRKTLGEVEKLKTLPTGEGAGKYLRLVLVRGALLFVKGAVWKALFGKEADKLEQANDDARTFYIIEREPLINTYISVPKENSTLNCASFTAGIVEAVLTHSGFPAKVTAHWHKGTTLMIKFEEAVIARDRALEGR